MNRVLLILVSLFASIAMPSFAQTQSQSQQGLACAKTFSGNNFSTSGTQFLAPNGQPYVFHGINIYWQETGNGTPDALLQKYPGLNFLRLNFYNPDLNVSPEQVAQYVLALNAKGVFVELEYHEYKFTLGSDQLGQVSAWYSQMASLFKGDSLVGFGSQNEPDNGNIQNEVSTLYNAVRATGNNTLFFVNPRGGYDPSGVNLSGMTNVAWDGHFYAWEGSDPAALSAFTSKLYSTANIPILIGEFGPAAADGVDPGGMNLVPTVLNSGLSSAAWAWRTWNPSPYPGDLVTPPWNGSSKLTEFGSMVAAFMPAAGACAGVPVALNAQCAVPSDATVQAAQAALASTIASLSGNGSSGSTGGSSGGSGMSPGTASGLDPVAAQSSLADAQAAICTAPTFISSTSNEAAKMNVPASQAAPTSATAPVVTPNATPIMQNSMQPTQVPADSTASIPASGPFGSGPVTVQTIEAELATVQAQLAALQAAEAATSSQAQPPVDTGATQATGPNVAPASSTATVTPSASVAPPMPRPPAPELATGVMVPPMASLQGMATTADPGTQVPASHRRHRKRGRDDVVPDNDGDAD